MILLWNFLKAFYSIVSIHLSSFRGEYESKRYKETITQYYIPLNREEFKIEENLHNLINIENLI